MVKKKPHLLEVGYSFCEFQFWIERDIVLILSSVQVMQGGCTVPPTKPKGRPKKNSIPSLGDTTSKDPSILARHDSS